MIGIVDYGAGNFTSVARALDRLHVQHGPLKTAQDLENYEAVIFPGVGSFTAALETLNQNGLFSSLQTWVEEGKPYLGICLGLQLLLHGSAEGPGRGLSLFPGTSLLFPRGKKPQMGWNEVQFKTQHPLLADLKSTTFFYFLHSYYASLSTEEGVLGTTSYVDVTYPSILARERVVGVQFHPEKSGEDGLKLLRNWVKLC